MTSGARHIISRSRRLGILASMIGVGVLSPKNLPAQHPFTPPSQRISPLEPRPFLLTPEETPLPPLDVLQPRIEATAYPPLQIHVAEFRFQGNHVFTSQQLAEVVAPYSGRTITAEELEQARLAVTAHYVKNGYVNSGAVLEDQNLDGDVVIFKIAEGTLNSIEVRGNRWLRSNFIKRRISHWSGPPLKLDTLQEALLLLNQQPVIVKVNADLQPGDEPGQSRLVVNVQERFPFHAGLEFSNDRPASVGAEHLDFIGAAQSLTGNGDSLDFRIGLLNRSENGFESGFENFGVAYTLPLSSWETTLRVSYQQNDYTIIEQPFSILDIDGRSNSFDVTLRQPLHRTLKSEFALSLTGSRRHSESFLRGQPFSLSPGAVDGETDVTVIRFGQEWLYRTQRQVIALRSSFHFGIEALDATKNGTERDGEFFSWLGQAQFVQRLDQRGSQLIVRVDGQWTDEPLLSLEQLAIGGMNTVRGYRENLLVRDTGVIGSAELRIPIWLSGSGKPIVQVAGFYDIGAGWDVGFKTVDPKMIHSIGGGLIITYNEQISGEIYWAHRLTDVDTSSDGDLQDEGINFRVSVLAF